MSAANCEHPIVTAGGLILDSDGRILLLKTHKWGDRYGIPGGKIDLGETMEAALLREIKEETGLDAGDVRFVLVQESLFSGEFHQARHFILLNYICRITAPHPPVQLNDEAQSYRWVTPAEAVTLDLNAPTRRLVEQVMQQEPANG